MYKKNVSDVYKKFTIIMKTSDMCWKGGKGKNKKSKKKPKKEKKEKPKETNANSETR